MLLFVIEEAKGTIKYHFFNFSINILVVLNLSRRGLFWRLEVVLYPSIQYRDAYTKNQANSNFLPKLSLNDFCFPSQF